MGNGLLRKAIDDACKAVLIRCLSVTNGNVALAAKNAGINRTYLYELMRRYGLKVERRKVASVVQAGPRLGGDGEWR